MTLTDKERIKAYLSLHTNISPANARQIIADLWSEKQFWPLADDWRDFFLDSIYGAMGVAYSELKDWDNAIDYLKLAIGAAEKNWPEYGYVSKHTHYHNLFVCYCNKLMKDEALDARRKEIFNEMKLTSNVHYPHFDFYTFRNTKSFAIADLKENKISFSSLSDFNDPVDSAYFQCADYYISTIEDPVMKMMDEVSVEAYNGLRAKCFITSRHLPNHTNYRPSMIDIAPYLNTIMWAHYADYHKGYCAMYNFPSDITSVKDSEGYVLHTGEIDYVEEMQYPSEINFQLGFMTKSKRWEYEHEKRMLYFQRDGVAAGHPEVKLPNGCLKEVYIGLRCENEAAIKDALDDKPDVKVFKIQISEQDIYSLEAVEIDRTTWTPIGQEPVKPQCALKRVFNCLKKSIKNECEGLK